MIRLILASIGRIVRTEGAPYARCLVVVLSMIFLADCRKNLVAIQQPSLPALPVEAPEQPPQPPEVLDPTLLDVHFEYGRSALMDSELIVLKQDAAEVEAFFRAHPSTSVAIEGHAEERGSAEYNLGLSDQRAMRVKEYLVDLGLPEDRLNTISYGKEHPQCVDVNEDCGRYNRRVHLALRR